MRATKAIIEQRVQDVLRLRLEGGEFVDVREWARKNEKKRGSHWKLEADAKPISDGQLYRYIADADRLIAESCRASRKKMLRRHLAQRRHLYAKSVKKGLLRTALAVLKDDAKLRGLYPPTKVAPTSPSGDKEYGHGLNDAERVAALHALYARVGVGTGATAADGPDAAGGPVLGGPDPPPDRSGDGAGPLADGAAPLFA